MQAGIGGLILVPLGALVSLLILKIRTFLASPPLANDFLLSLESTHTTFVFILIVYKFLESF